MDNNTSYIENINDLCRNLKLGGMKAGLDRMLVEIKECESKRKLSRLYKKYEKYDLAILDECGYMSLDKVAAEQLFNLISLRSDRKSTIITTNLGFDKWDTIFTDKVVVAAIVDRLTFKSYIIDMNAPSYRISATEQWISERAEKKAAEGKKALK